MRVFVSSTIYDLLDIRSELEQLLRELGIAPVMSDHKLSKFNLAFDANSIETCLLNVEVSDAVIVILDQRYGPKLGDCGFDNISATHLEYRHAKLHNKPIYFYVRDRLEADFTIRQKNNIVEDVQYSWVSPKNHGLFEFLADHRKLRADSQENNWFSLFSNSVDLKASIRQHFEPVIKPQVLLKAIQENLFPIFSSELKIDELQIGNVPSLQCNFILKNVSLAPAFDLKLEWQIEGQDSASIDLIAPGQQFKSTAVSNRDYGDFSLDLKVEYQAIIGVTVRECHTVLCFIQSGTMFSGAILKERTYHNTPPPSLVIQDA
tara:strand:- start:1546 stop:2502 length:957 start_codon:yes stop_codon:yes gene_type:complete